MPLTKLHAIGSQLGRLMYFMMPHTVKLIHDNLKQSQLFNDHSDLNPIIRKNLQELGKSIIESLAIWQKPKSEVLSWIRSCENWMIVDQALAKKKGIIFLTPHMGCFEITSIFYGSSHPITVLFRKPKKKWLRSLTSSGRQHNNMIKLAPANATGVKMLVQALKKGEAIGILPDQTPGKGEGDWAPFFNKDAYTMTLVSKLANKTGATVIMAFGERLENGEGFNVHLNALPDGTIANAVLLNKAIENQINKNPLQYLWSYPRYKARRKILRKREFQQ
jgi:Kdo2-lipid IVA lauroyltransferase/acyltransferase